MAAPPTTISPPILAQQKKFQRTDLDIVSYSAAVKPASENRIRPFSELFGAFVWRFPVLRFLGMERSAAAGDWLRPLSLSAGYVSSPGEERIVMSVRDSMWG